MLAGPWYDYVSSSATPWGTLTTSAPLVPTVIMTETLVCARCQLTGEAIAGNLALSDELSRKIRERICQRCWKEWEDMEVMVINELRLNFIDPAAQETLRQRMREFLELDSPSQGD